MEFFETFPFTKLQGKNRGLDWVIQKVTEFKKIVDNIPETVNSAVEKAIKNVITDKTLTLDSVPADSKAVGDKINSLTAADVDAAPGDYGLGGASKILTSADDLNNIKANGWYQWNYNDKPKNIPSSSGTVYMSAMRVTVDGAACLQEIFDTSNSTFRGGRVQRVIYGGTVFEWEWVRPPMIVGIEYRTIERWKGKPVYTMLVDCGYLPNASTKDTQYRSNGVVDEPIEWYGVYANQQAAVGNSSFEVLVTKTFVRIVTKSDKSAFTAQIAVKYTKN